jgi:hypothetical protein
MKKHVKPMLYISSKQIDESFDIFAASILAELFIRVGCNYKTDKERGRNEKTIRTDRRCAAQTARRNPCSTG